MSIAELIQVVGVLVGLLVVLQQLLVLIRDWRGGTPEHRTITEALRIAQSTHTELLQRIVERVKELK